MDINKIIEDNMKEIDRMIQECDKEQENKTSEADKMFEELGYEKDQITDEFINYSKKELKYNNSTKKYEICIYFNCYDKYLGIKNKQFFSLEELQAIYLKCKELGWI